VLEQDLSIISQRVADLKSPPRPKSGNTQMIHENRFVEMEQEPQLEHPKILAIGGGKGGIGKTVLSASLGVGLAMLKKRVVLVDVDLGGANLHMVLGIEKPSKTYYNFMIRQKETLEDVLIPHPEFENLQFISGANGSFGIANMPAASKKRFIRHILKINADYIILDLGAGTSYNMLDFFLVAHQGIVVVTPDPLSLLDSYNFVKSCLFRRIAQIIRGHKGAQELIRDVIRSEIHRSESTVHDLVRDMKEFDVELGGKIEGFLDSFHPMFLVNMLKHARDKSQIQSVQAAVKQLLNIEMDNLGAISHDETVGRSICEKRPFISLDPKSPASRDLANMIITQLLHVQRFQAIKDKRTLRRTLKDMPEIPQAGVICSVRCPYWEDCEFKQGGHLCGLSHATGIHGVRGETS